MSALVGDVDPIESRPRIAPWLVSAPVLKDGVYLLGERTDGVLAGTASLEVAPLLDGSRTPDEIVDALTGVVDLPTVYYLIELARRSGYVLDEPAPDDVDAEAFWGTMGVAQEARRWVASPPGVRVRALGGGGEEFAAAVKDLGWRADADADGLDVVLVDDYLDPRLEQINADALANGRAWVPAKLTGTQLWLGPVIEPGVSACWACLEQRLSSNREVWSHVSWHSGGVAVPSLPSPSTPSSRAVGANLLALLMARRAAGLPAAGDKLLMLDLMTFTTTEHHVVRRPQCRACGDPALAQEDAPIVLGAQARVPNADGYRAVSAEATFERLRHHISPLVGAVTELERMTDPADPTMHVYYAGHNFAVRSRDLHYLKEGLRSKSSGKGSNAAQGKASAIGEALERYSGIFQGDEPRITATYASLGEQAIHPNAMTTFSERQYAQRDAWLERESRFAVVPLPFDETAEVEWTRVWSVTSNAWRLIPTGYLYYGYPHRADQFFYWSDSNGNAAGNSLDEAVLQGCLELVERDAVAIWWYNRLRRPALDLDSFDDLWIDAVRQRYAALGRPVWVLDVTSDLGIPAFVALSARTDDPVEDILIACGAHLDPRIAVHRALGEINQFLPAVLPRHDGTGDYAFPDPDCQEWWSTATRVSQPYLLPAGDLPPTRYQDFPSHVTTSISAGVEQCRAAIEKAGLEMLVLNQTRPDVGLPVAKVIVPGLRHFWARLGPGRLYTVPVDMGWLKEPVNELDLNPIPLFL